MTHADVYVDPGEAELDPLSRAFIESEAAHGTAKKNVTIVARVLAARRRRASTAASCCASWSRRSRSWERSGWRASASATTSWPTTSPARSAPGPRTQRRRSHAGWCSARSATAAPPWRACPSTSARAVIPNERGRVIDGNERVTGEYAVGWIKRGPTGIIGTNKRDAQETVDAAARGPRRRPPARSGRPRPRLARRPGGRAPARRRLLRRLAGHRRGRRTAGEPHGRPRVKLCTFEELLPWRPRAARPARVGGAGLGRTRAAEPVRPRPRLVSAGGPARSARNRRRVRPRTRAVRIRPARPRPALRRSGPGSAGSAGYGARSAAFDLASFLLPGL